MKRRRRWRNTQTGDVAVWFMSGSSVKGGALVAQGVPAVWAIAAMGDLDGDGRADLLWRHTQSGDVSAWLMDGATIKQSDELSPGVPLGWQIAGIGDAGADGQAKVIWRHAQSGDVAVWIVNAAGRCGEKALSVGSCGVNTMGLFTVMGGATVPPAVIVGATRVGTLGMFSEKIVV